MSESTSPDGGENGSDGKVATLPLGEPSQPGHGSGQDVSMYHMKYFHLTPGKGGKAGTEISGWVAGLGEEEVVCWSMGKAHIGEAMMAKAMEGEEGEVLLRNFTMPGQELYFWKLVQLQPQHHSLLR